MLMQRNDRSVSPARIPHYYNAENIPISQKNIEVI